MKSSRSATGTPSCLPAATCFPRSPCRSSKGGGEIKDDKILCTVLNDKKFSKVVGQLIKFKSGMTRVPIKDTSWEELIWAALVFMYGENKVDWNSQSHEKSVDIKAKINGKILKISAKGGTIENGSLKVSSYRLTTFSKLEDKLDFIKNQHENFDFYLICAREINKADGSMKYIVIKAPSWKLAPSGMLNAKNWKRTKTGYELKKGIGLDAKIVFKMSNQLWYAIPVGYFSSSEKIVEVSIPYRELGRGLLQFLKSKLS